MKKCDIFLALQNKGTQSDVTGYLNVLEDETASNFKISDYLDSDNKQNVIVDACSLEKVAMLKKSLQLSESMWMLEQIRTRNKMT